MANLPYPRLVAARAGGPACRSRVASAYSIERVAADFAALHSGLCAARAPEAAL